NYTVISVSGDVVDDARDVFIKQLYPIVGDTGKQVLLDLSAPKYINSAGIGQLVSLVARANTNGCRVILVSPSPFISEVLNRTKLETFFQIVEDRKEAEQLVT
ncbi:MAG: STAS domain-containing protein, partial [Woeseiaceae bacterium]